MLVLHAEVSNAQLPDDLLVLQHRALVFLREELVQCFILLLPSDGIRVQKKRLLGGMRQ